MGDSALNLLHNILHDTFFSCVVIRKRTITSDDLTRGRAMTKQKDFGGKCHEFYDSGGAQASRAVADTFARVRIIPPHRTL